MQDNHVTNERFKLDKKHTNYANTIAFIVQDARCYPQIMTKLLDHLYLGSLQNALNVDALKNEGITHVINTVDDYFEDGRTKKSLYGDSFEYLSFNARDQENYPIMDHFHQCYDFIEDARKKGGKCLIHCIAGINRSGCSATAYVMVHQNVGPISAAQKVFEARGALLSNYGFIKQLVRFAVQKDLLEIDKESLLPIYKQKTCCGML